MLQKLAAHKNKFTLFLLLAAASTVSVGLEGVRIWRSGTLHYDFLLWNLGLAWIPFMLAALAYVVANARKPILYGVILASAVAWLVFFPNAPYIFTDLFHLTARLYSCFWVDLCLILLCALTGLVLGFVSLYLMQSVVERMLGRTASWVFIAGVAALSGFGIYLGRFMRFNSWDVLFKPHQVYHGIGHWVTNPLSNSNSLAFPVLFGTFLFITYLMLYALTHLKAAQPMTLPRKIEAPGLA